MDIMGYANGSGRRRFIQSMGEWRGGKFVGHFNIGLFQSVWSGPAHEFLQ